MSALQPSQLTAEELVRYAYFVKADDGNLYQWVKALHEKLEEALVDLDSQYTDAE
jgi:hypothetical protein